MRSRGRRGWHLQGGAYHRSSNRHVWSSRTSSSSSSTHLVGGPQPIVRHELGLHPGAALEAHRTPQGGVQVRKDVPAAQQVPQCRTVRCGTVRCGTVRCGTTCTACAGMRHAAKPWDAAPANSRTHVRRIRCRFPITQHCSTSSCCYLPSAGVNSMLASTGRCR
jgi:hypothetical protein